MPERHILVKVFLADDWAPMRARVTAMLQAHAMTVIGHAETPQGAIDGILSPRPDVVVLDVQLAGGSGLEVLRTVRVAVPEIAFIVFSNNSGLAYRKRYLGMTLETVSRTFSAFQQQRLLEVDKRHIRIIDPDALARAFEMRVH